MNRVLFFVCSFGGTEAKVYALICSLRNKFIKDFVSIPGTDHHIMTLVPQGIKLHIFNLGPVYLQVRKSKAIAVAFPSSGGESEEFSGLPLATKLFLYKLLKASLAIPVSTEDVQDTGL